MLQILITFFFSLCVAYAITPLTGKKLLNAGIYGCDVHKLHKPKRPEGGGAVVLIGFFAGFLTILYLSRIEISVELYAAVCAVLGAALVGILDDIKNIRQRDKALLPFIFAIPLALKLNDTTLTFTDFGNFNAGFIMIILVPLAITSAANVNNMLEGFNGLGSGMGAIICGTLAIIAFLKNEFISLYFLLPLLGALIGFFFYNRYPASIFPGDTLTLFVGATIAVSAILGNMEFLGAILFIPFIIEFVLKTRGRIRYKRWADSFGKLDNSGRLYYKGPIESLTHWFIKLGCKSESKLVCNFWLIELCLGASVIAIYLFG